MKVPMVMLSTSSFGNFALNDSNLAIFNKVDLVIVDNGQVAIIKSKLTKGAFRQTSLVSGSHCKSHHGVFSYLS